MGIAMLNGRRLPIDELLDVRDLVIIMCVDSAGFLVTITFVLKWNVFLANSCMSE